MQIPNDFFTVTSIGTLAGASAAVYLVTSIIGTFITSQSIQTFKRLLSLILSFVLAYLAASLIKDKSVSTWVVAFFNGCLIYITATGANAILSPKTTAETPPAPAAPPAAAEAEAASRGPAPAAAPAPAPQTKRKFNDRWW